MKTNRLPMLARVALLMSDALNSTDLPTARKARFALDCIEWGEVYRGIGRSFWVKSESGKGVWYEVNGKTCTCPARGICKHRYAVKALWLYEQAALRLAAEELVVERVAEQPRSVKVKEKLGGRPVLTARQSSAAMGNRIKQELNKHPHTMRVVH